MAQGPGGYAKRRSFRKENRGAAEGQELGRELVSADQARLQAARAAAGAREPVALGLTHLPIHRAPVRTQARDPNPRPERP